MVFDEESKFLDPRMKFLSLDKVAEEKRTFKNLFMN